MRKTLSAAIALALLSGCGEPEKDPDNEPQQPDLIDYSHLEMTRPTTGALQLADEATLARHIKNGLRLTMAAAYSGFGGSSPPGGGSSSSGGLPPPTPTPAPSPVPSPGSGGDAGSGGGGDAFSDTNVHVAGVDESDFAKFDGAHWYVATSTTRTTDLTISGSAGFQIVSTDPTVPAAEILGQFKLDEQWGNVGEMYLVGEPGATSRVVLLRGQYGTVPIAFPTWGGSGTVPMPTPPPVPTPTPTPGPTPTPIPIPMPAPASSEPAPVTVAAAAMPGWFEPVNGKVRVQLVDVEDPQAPSEAWDIQLDGTLIDSRKIGDVLYLVTRFEPWVQGLHFGGSDAAVSHKNEEILVDQPLSALVPQFQIAGGERQPLTTDCFVQQDLPENSGFASLVHITAVDLSAQSILSSRCLNSAISAISMSQDSLYLTGEIMGSSNWRGGDTVIHKFALDEASGLTYAATGSVTGSIHGQSDPAFRLHEHGDELRVVTTRWTTGPEHQLFILKPEGQTLETVAMLPNSDRPEPLGKPNEDIFSVRFEAERAFIVTFQRTDPLYAIDLSDPLDPKVAGELEIPGFATYMHPLNERYLFTLGREASNTGVAQGIKAELIDLSGGDPVSVNSLVFGDRNSHSEALHNLRALNFLQVDDDTWRIAFPYRQSISSFQGDGQTWQTTQINGLQLMEITGLEGDGALLEDAGFIEAENGVSAYSSLVSRGLLQGDAAFYTHKNAIWAAAWGAAELATGPITAAPPSCDTHAVDGIELTISLESAGQHDACETTVTISDGAYEAILEPRASQSTDQSCLFTGATERAGNYAIAAELPGFERQYRRVIVWQDECHVITEKPRLTLLDCSLRSPSGLEVFVQVPGEVQCASGRVSMIQDGTAHALDWIGGGDIIDEDGIMQSYCYYVSSGELPQGLTLEVDFDGYAPYEESGINLPHETCSSNAIQRELFLTPL